jgi:hypothetical protein
VSRTPRWKPMPPEEEAAFYQRLDEGIAKYGITFTRPMTLEQRLDAAYRAGQALWDEQGARRRRRSRYAQYEAQARADCYNDKREGMRFLEGWWAAWQENGRRPN